MVDDQQEELAWRRTRWAAERTALSNERTFTAWLRTGLAALAAGYVIAKLTVDFRPQWVTMTLGAILCLVAAAMEIVGLITYVRTAHALPRQGMRPWTSAIMTAVLIFVSLAGAVFLIID